VPPQHPDTLQRNHRATLERVLVAELCDDVRPRVGRSRFWSGGGRHSSR